MLSHKLSDRTESEVTLDTTSAEDVPIDTTEPIDETTPEVTATDEDTPESTASAEQNKDNGCAGLSVAATLVSAIVATLGVAVVKKY